jgi:translocation and assembly module TamB
MAGGTGFSKGNRGPMARVLWWCGGTVLVLSMVLVIALGVLFRTETGRSIITDLAEELAERQGLALEIGSIEGALPFDIRLGDVRLADGDGEFLSLGGASVLADAGALLQGQLVFEAISLRKLAVKRPPNLPSAENAPSSGGDGGGLSSLAITVRALSVDSLSIGAAFLGEVLDLGITASTSVDPGAGINADFAVRRLDGDGRIEGRFESDAALSRLKVSIRGETASGGLISRLIGLPGAPGVTVDLEGDGPVESFVARYAIAAGTAVGTEGEIRLSSAYPLALKIKGIARVAEFAPLDLRLMIGDRVEYGLAASLNADSTLLEVVDLQVATALASANGSVKLRLDDLAVDADLSAEVTRPDLLETMVTGLRIEGGGVDISATGPVSRIDAKAKIWIDDVSFQDHRVGRIETVVTAALAETVKAAATITASGLDLPTVPAGAIGGTITGGAKAVLSGRSLSLSDLRARSGPAQLTGDAAVNLGTSTADLSLAVSHDAIGGLTPILDRGRVDADIHGRFDGRFLALQIGGRLADIAIRDPDLARLTSGGGDLWLDVQQISPTDWRISDLEIDTGRVRMQARGTVDAASSSGDVKVTVAIPALGDVDPSQSIEAGGAILSASIQGGAELVDVDWRLVMTELEAEKISVPRFEGAGGLQIAGAVAAGDLAFGAETSLGQMDAATKYRWDGGTLALSDLSARRGPDIVDGALTLRPEPLAIDGALDIAIPDIGKWGALADLALEGELGARIELSSGQSGQRVGVAATVTGVRVDKGAATVDRIELVGAVDDAFGPPVMDGKVSFTNASAGATSADTLSLAATGPMTAVDFKVEGSGAFNDLAMRAGAAGTLGLGDARTMTLDQLTVTGDAGRISLNRPTRISLDEGRAELETLSLSLFGGELVVSGRLESDRIQGSLSVKRVAVPPIANLAGLDISDGQLNAEASVSGTLSSPSGAFDLVLDDLQGVAGEGGDVPPLSVEIGARLDAGALAGKARLAGLGAEPLVVTLNSRIPEPGGVLPVDARALWRGDLGALTATLPLEGYVIAGNAGIDLTVKGDYDPATGRFMPRQTSGGLTINEGRIESLLAGTLLDPVRVDVALDGTRLIVRKLDAGDSEAGTFKVTGTVDLVELARPDVNLDAVMEAMTLVRRDDADVQLDARIGIRSMENRIKVVGEIRNRNTEIRLIGNLPAGIEELDVEEVGVGAPTSVESEEAPSSGTGPPIDLDIKISSPGRIFVRGRGLESEWGAAIQVSGTVSDPLLVGEVAPIRGGFEFAGKQFVLGEGGVTLSGGLDADPRLGLSAIHAGTDFTATVSVKGSARKPEVSLSSDPSYPEDEVLALILFGQSKAELSAVEVLQLAQSARTLLSGEAGTLDKVRKSIGVDVLTFAPGEGNDKIGRLKAGKYLRDDVYVGVEQGTGPGSSRSVVEWSVTPNVTVEGTVGSASQGTLGIQRRWEY